MYNRTIIIKKCSILLKKVIQKYTNLFIKSSINNIQHKNLLNLYFPVNKKSDMILIKDTYILSTN